MWLAEEIWQKRLHARAGKEGGRVVFEDEWRWRDDLMPVFDLKI